MKEITNPVDELIIVIATAVEKWKAENTPEVLTNQVNKLLNSNTESMVLALLGFEKDHWKGQWSVDHCNGRSGESSVGDYLRKTHSVAIKDFFDNIQLPKLSTATKSKLAKDMDYEYQNTLRSTVSLLARQKAEEDAQKIFDKLRSTEAFNKYKQLLDIVDPKPN